MSAVLVFKTESSVTEAGKCFTAELCPLYLSCIHDVLGGSHTLSGERVWDKTKPKQNDLLDDRRKELNR